jgi:hypothetical protein
MKRYKIVVQHEVVFYAESEKAAEENVLATPFMKSRTNPRCVYVTEIPLPEDERQAPVIDERRAPGS